MYDHLYQNGHHMILLTKNNIKISTKKLNSSHFEQLTTHIDSQTVNQAK
jgi:hypothetical protein